MVLMLRDLLFNLRDLNQACKEYYLKADLELSSISIIGAVFIIPPMAYLDYIYYRLGSDFYLSVFAELLFGVFSIGIVFFIRRTRQVKTYERLVFIWSLITSIFALIVTYLQPSRVIENILFSLLFLIASFFTLQNRFLFRMIPAGIIYISFLAVFLTNHTWFTFPSNYMLTLVLLILTLVGITVVVSNNRFRLITFALQKDEREARLLYEVLSRTDPLTGIPNRRNFYDHVEQEWNRYKRYSFNFCIAVIDLDRLKEINDTYGHALGDDVLKGFSTLAATHMRSTDFFARVGGDEFAILLRETNQHDALNVIARLREKVLAWKLDSPDKEISITLSAGVAEVQSADISLDEMIQRADLALYKAKEMGRDRIEKG